jgi:hypothetical protein
VNANGGPGQFAIPVFSISRHLYPSAAFEYGPASKLCPGIGIETADEGEAMVLVFQLPDQTQHVFVLEEEGRKALVAKLTGVRIEVAHSLPERPAEERG